MPNVAVDQAGTYKCVAENEFGRAIVTATLNVIEGKQSLRTKTSCAKLRLNNISKNQSRTQ